MIKFQTSEDFLDFLGVPHDHLPSTSPKIRFTSAGFVKTANAIARSIRNDHFRDEDYLVFKSTGKTAHRGHITETECKPRYTATFQGHWRGKNTTVWPCIRLVGEAASKGKTRSQQLDQAVSYLDCLLLARPDLHVAQGLLTTGSDITFLFGIGGFGIRNFSLSWKSLDLNRLMYAFIYRLYEPGHFADSSYVEMVPNLEENLVRYTVRITAAGSTEEILCPDLLPIYASSPFETRTHILSNPDSKVNVNGGPLTVLKGQVCPVGTWFSEYSILERIHSPEKVPGVVQAVYHTSFEIPQCGSRIKHRLGLRQTGKPFMTIPTLQQMLEIVFDILEVLRYLRFERSILHRDISKGNVLYLEDDLPPLTGTMSDAQYGGANRMAEPKEVPLCFIKYLLGESNDPHKTSALLIDFNHAEDLANKQGLEYQRTIRTGTPIFIARAVEFGHAVEPPLVTFIIPAVPKSPAVYSFNHPDRIERFPVVGFQVVEDDHWQPVTENQQWRHELDHDTESVFWLLLYWAIAAQPEECGQELIDTGIWGMLTGTADSRSNLIGSRSSLDRATHSFYRPLLGPLLCKLAAILDVDRHWLEPSDARNHPGYLNEALQRSILRFMLDNRHEGFMKHKVQRHPRRPIIFSESFSDPELPSQKMNGEATARRPIPGPSNPTG